MLTCKFALACYCLLLTSNVAYSKGSSKDFEEDFILEVCELPRTASVRQRNYPSLRLKTVPCKSDEICAETTNSFDVIGKTHG